MMSNDLTVPVPVCAPGTLSSELDARRGMVQQRVFPFSSVAHGVRLPLGSAARANYWPLSAPGRWYYSVVQ
jgi:hypothetical protein